MGKRRLPRQSYSSSALTQSKDARTQGLGAMYKVRYASTKESQIKQGLARNCRSFFIVGVAAGVAKFNQINIWQHLDTPLQSLRVKQYLEDESMKKPINKVVLSGWMFLFSPMINASASLPVLAPYLASWFYLLRSWPKSPALGNAVPWHGRVRVRVAQTAV